MLSYFPFTPPHKCYDHEGDAYPRPKAYYIDQNFAPTWTLQLKHSRKLQHSGKEFSTCKQLKKIITFLMQSSFLSREGGVGPYFFLPKGWVHNQINMATCSWCVTRESVLTWAVKFLVSFGGSFRVSGYRHEVREASGSVAPILCMKRWSKVEHVGPRWFELPSCNNED